MDTLSNDLLISIMSYTAHEHAILCRISRRLKMAYLAAKSPRPNFTARYLMEPFSLFQWLHCEYNCPIDATTFVTAAKGVQYYATLKWLHERSNAWDANTIDAIIERGDLDTLKWLYDEGCPWNEWSLRKAAREGQMHILCWAHAHRNDDPIVRAAFARPLIVASAAAHGHLNLLAWFYAIGTPFCETVSIFAAKNGHWEIVVWLVLRQFPYNTDYILIHAAAQCHVPMLVWALNYLQPIPRDNKAIVAALARRGSAPIIQWLIREGFEYESADLLYQATLNGNFPVMQWLVDEFKCDLSERIFEAAASRGDICTLEWLHMLKCPSNNKVCVAAAKQGNYIVFDWARRTLGCALTVDAAIVAAAEGHLAFLKWLIEQGCPYDDKVKQMAALRRQRDVVKWLNSRGTKVHVPSR